MIPPRSCPSKATLWLSVPVAAILIAGSGAAETSPADKSQLERGEYIARAAGCMSCHGEDLAGGYEVETPMGTIVASNISPSRDYGIGRYNRNDLADVLRRGVSPSRRLYPAMPYASYRGIADADLDDLFVWLQDQDAVEQAPDTETDLPFPFNIRTGVMVWNGLFLGERQLPNVEDPVLRRGAYLVDHLGHCGECHTPRNVAFDMQDDQYLAGATLDGWLAPNLTPDPLTGIGGWADQEIIEYLRVGTAGNVVQAAGPMGQFVQHSTSHLDDADLAAMVAYLRTIPAINTADQDIPILLAAPDRIEPQHRFGQIRDEMSEALAKPELTEAEQLYLTHCAACHGVTGQGQPQAYYPPLVQNAALRRADAGNLLQVLASGVPAGKLYRSPAMPGFADELGAGQIALLANYTRVTFGGRENSNLTAADVHQVLAPQEEMPLPLRVLQVAAWIGLLGMMVVFAFIIGWVVRRRNKRQEA